MTVVDLHPEDLLEKEARGALRDSERIRLEAHTSKCATCRVERAMRLDFAAELEGDVEEPSLTGLLDLDSILRQETRRAPMPMVERRRIPRWAIGSVAVAALLAASVAGATVGGRVWTRATTTPRTDVTSSDVLASAPLATTAPHARRADHAASNAPAEMESSAVTLVETVDTLVAPEAAIAPASAPAPRVSREDEAAALFDAASLARRQGDYPRTIALYRDLESRFASTREAQISHATLGRLLLDRGDAAGALASFDAYLASGAGELREETMAGRARALEHLGRADDARRAWESLLVLFPSTPYATHARSQIDAASTQAAGH